MTKNDDIIVSGGRRESDSYDGLLQFLGTDDSGAGRHRELVDLGRERPPGLTLTGNDLPLPGTTLAGNDLWD